MGVLQRGGWASVKFSRKRRRPPPFILARIDRPMNLFKRSAILNGKRPFCVLSRLWGLRATYDVILGSSESSWWTFYDGIFSLGVMAKALRANIDWKSAFSLQRGQFAPKFQVEGIAPTNYSSCHKTRMNDLSRGRRM